MEHKRKLLLIWVLVISLVGGAALTAVFAGSSLSFVVDSYAEKDAIYMIDDKEDQISVIKTDSKGKIQSEIKVDKVKKGIVSTLDYLTLDKDNVYVYEIEREIKSNQVLSESVYLCDFNKNKLIEAWNLPIADKEAQNNFAISVRKGQLYFFNIQYDKMEFLAQAVVNTMKAGEKKETPLAVVNYDVGIGFTDFFYSDNGDIVFTTPEGKIFKGADEALNRNEKPLRAEMPKQVTTEAIAEPEVTTSEVVGAADENLSEGGVQVVEALDVEAVASAQFKEDGNAPSLVGVPHYESVEIYPGADVDGGHITNFSGEGHNIYYMDLTKGCFSTIDLNNTEYEKKISIPEVSYNGKELKLSELRNIRFTDKNNFSATIAVGEGKALPGIFSSGEGYILEKLTVSAGHLALSFILYSLGIAACFLLAYVLRGLFLTVSKGRLPILAKVIMACLPVVIISILLLQWLINSMFVGQTVDNQYKELYLVSKQQTEGVSAQLLSEIDIQNPYNDVYYYQLRQLLNALPAESEVYGQRGNNDSNQQIYDFSYHWLYKVDGSSLRSLYCGQNYIDVPIEYYYDEATATLMYDAVAKKKTMKGSFKDVGGDWIVLAIPILDEDRNVVAVMETGVTKASLEQAVHENTQKINIANLGILVILVLVLSVLLMICLAPLKKLKASVFEIISGNMGVQTEAKGRDEVAEIGQVFNQMSKSIEVNINELRRLNQGYFKFVPAKMFRLLRKSSVVDVRLGDQVNADITILSFNAVRFENLVSSMNAEEMFKMINKVLSNLVPVVTVKGGVVDKFENAGLIAFYTKGSEDALTSAVSVCQTMEQMNRDEAFGEGIYIDMTSGISHGPVMIGIVGHAERLAATTISEHTNLSGFLQKIAPKYGARILLTASAIEQIENFDGKFNGRWVGFLHVTVNDTTEKLYDVFDGDDDESKVLKGQTKALFERGVSLYCEKDFYEARLVFIEVLKQNRNDGAAKEYLYRCDQYYQMSDTSKISLCIEEY